MESINVNKEIKIDEVKNIYFLGIGGIGMSALARYFLNKKCHVYGYDKTPTELTEQLENEGAKIHYQEDVALVSKLFTPSKKLTNEILICYTPAIPSDNKEFVYFKNEHFSLYKRAEILGFISQNYFTIAIAGTHGKTTTSSMIAYVLDACKLNCTAFLGGISLNFNSNLLIDDKAKILVVEADEFDRSFLQLSPNIAIITSLDADHLDVYGNQTQMQEAYKLFVKKIKKEGCLITKSALLNQLKCNQNIKYYTYSKDTKADFYAQKVEIKDGNYFIKLKCNNEVVDEIKMGLPGIHNVENAIGSFAVAKILNLDNTAVKQALSQFKGVKRRFQYHIKNKNLIYIDDYAHHPTELQNAIQSIRDLFPNKKITGIFQPHLYTRTKDFAAEFAHSLSLLDELILLDIYPAREKPIKGVTSQIILDKVVCKQKILIEKKDLLAYIKKHQFEVLITLGAGDIDTLIIPIKEILEHKIPLLN